MRYAFAFPALMLVLLLTGCSRKDDPGTSSEDRYIQLMNTGKNYLDQGKGTNALPVYLQAANLAPTDPDVHLNIANAYLLAGQADSAVRAADEVLKLDPNSAAAYFVKGSALLRALKFEEALKALEAARQLDPSETALAFQLGAAHFQLRHWDEAIALFSEVVAVQPEHPSANYQLSQALQRAGREEEAQRALLAHQQVAAKNAGTTLRPEMLEKSRFTEARVPFRLEQPAASGIPVKFSDRTAAVIGELAGDIHGPIAVVDPNRNGTNSLFVLQKNEGFRILWNENGKLTPLEDIYPAHEGAAYARMLVGDLNNDRYEDVIVLGDKGAHVFRMATNGLATDVAPFSRLQNLAAIDGALVDLDFTGKLDLVAVTATNTLKLYRQFGPLLFTDITRTSGIPATIPNASSVVIDDWPRDEMMDVIVSRTNAAPLLLAKVRGGLLVETNLASWPNGSVIASGDLNNDLRTDLVVASQGKAFVAFHGMTNIVELALPGGPVHKVYTQDFDNDGWLDIWITGESISLFRNVGQAGFKNVSQEVGLNQYAGGFREMLFADFDNDCDTDAVATAMNGGIRYLQNDGGNGNQQLKVQLMGNRSNASGLGVKLELSAGGLRLQRTVQSLPVEIGIGKSQQLDSFVVHWFNLAVPSVDVPVTCAEPLPAIELTLPEGSCPYLYVWDGSRFRFVTDLLGAAPAGLPVADGRYIESDPEEYAWIGTEQSFKPRDGSYVVQITEELREALYLDEAKLVVVDRPTDVEVHPLDKLVPGRPFPPNALGAVRNEILLRSAVSLSERDVTTLLLAVDQKRVSPEKLRIPQQRGQAESHGVILDFGPLDNTRALTLVLNGWLRFGGGMANINASHDPSVGFPFPILEAETNGTWQKVDVTVGAPAGKTKTIMVDLAGKIPAGTTRLKLTAGFEIHWDRIALYEAADMDQVQVTHVMPSSADLHWRGFSEFEDLPWDWPLTPNYERVHPNPKWRITPGGWCTRYGNVLELLATRDEGLMTMNGGDELTLQFAVSDLPAKPAGTVREFFIYTDGWDKDSDFHVAAGTTIEPLPWHGMDDQLYGKQPRPEFPSDLLHKKYNTRWVPPNVLDRAQAK